MLHSAMHASAQNVTENISCTYYMSVRDSLVLNVGCKRHDMSNVVQFLMFLSRFELQMQIC
jgi:hypothetical protein